MSPGARNTDPSTSHIAAGLTPKLRSRDRIAVLLAHAQNIDGLTDFELGKIVGRQQTSAGKRRGELRDAGYIIETSLRRAAPSGAPAIVWKITVKGLSAARFEKTRHVLRAGQTRDHKCHWPECDKQVPPALWGCARHWAMLPQSIRSRIWRQYRAGQEEDMRPSSGYISAAQEAQEWIARKGPL